MLLHYFFFIIFLLLIPATGKPSKKNIYVYIFFSFSSKPNKFIEIYFIHLFSSFTHCKTLEFVFSSHHFFFPSVTSLLLQNCSSLNTATLYTSKFQEFNYKLFFLCKNWNKFPEFHKTVMFLSKTGATVQNFFFHLIMDYFSQNFLEHLFSH